jgi:hypothetical protein
MFSILTALGCLIGRGPYQMLDGSRHAGNLFVLLVGDTSSGRKGTAVAHAERVIGALDDVFIRRNVTSGLSTAEGLIECIRDATEETERRPADPGVADKRLLVMESEFATVTKRGSAKGSTLFQVLRDSWDGRTLRTRTRHNPLMATDPHVSFIGQITPGELRATTNDVDFDGGSLNRYLYAYVERTRLLPFGDQPPPAKMLPLVARLANVLGAARSVGEVRLANAARPTWAEMYGDLTAGEPGRVGAATRRGAPQVRRIAMLYTLLDGRREIEVAHLQAAMGAWRYSLESARYVFGGRQFSALATKFEEYLRGAGRDGLDMRALRKLSGSNSTATVKLRSALEELRSSGRARMSKEVPPAGSGRPREVWRHTRHALERAASDVGIIGTMGDNPPTPTAGPAIDPLNTIVPIVPDEKAGISGSTDGFTPEEIVAGIERENTEREARLASGPGQNSALVRRIMRNLR